jgi:hypothetical protein
MNDAPPRDRKEQRLLSNARREGFVILVVWALSLLWSVGYCYAFGYGRTDLQLVLGMPSWVFWGILVPWALCLVFSAWFCFVFMADDDLGQDPDEGQDHA